MDKIEQKRQIWLAKHKSDSDPAPWLTDEGIPDEAIKRKFLNHKARTGQTPDKANGIFGELSGRDGWIESIIKRQNGEYYTKDFSADIWKRAGYHESWFPTEDGVFIKLYWKWRYSQRNRRQGNRICSGWFWVFNY